MVFSIFVKVGTKRGPNTRQKKGSGKTTKSKLKQYEVHNTGHKRWIKKQRKQAVAKSDDLWKNKKIQNSINYNPKKKHRQTVTHDKNRTDELTKSDEDKPASNCRLWDFADAFAGSPQVLWAVKTHISSSPQEPTGGLYDFQTSR